MIPEFQRVTLEHLLLQLSGCWRTSPHTQQSHGLRQDQTYWKLKTTGSECHVLNQLILNLEQCQWPRQFRIIICLQSGTKLWLLPYLIRKKYLGAQTWNHVITHRHFHAWAQEQVRLHCPLPDSLSMRTGPQWSIKWTNGEMA